MQTMQILLTIEITYGKHKDSEAIAKAIEQRTYNYITARGATVGKCVAVVVPDGDKHD